MGQTLHHNRPPKGTKDELQKRPPHQPHVDDAEVVVAGGSPYQTGQDHYHEDGQREGGDAPLQPATAQQPLDRRDLTQRPAHLISSRT